MIRIHNDRNTLTHSFSFSQRILQQSQQPPLGFQPPPGPAMSGPPPPFSQMPMGQGPPPGPIPPFQDYSQPPPDFSMPPPTMYPPPGPPMGAGPPPVGLPPGPIPMGGGPPMMGVPPPGAPNALLDQQKLILQRVLQLTPQEIEGLPPAQREQVLQLQMQIVRVFHSPPPPKTLTNYLLKKSQLGAGMMP